MDKIPARDAVLVASLSSCSSSSSPPNPCDFCFILAALARRPKNVRPFLPASLSAARRYVVNIPGWESSSPRQGLVGSVADLADLQQYSPLPSSDARPPTHKARFVAALPLLAPVNFLFSYPDRGSLLQSVLGALVSVRPYLPDGPDSMGIDGRTNDSRAAAAGAEDMARNPRRRFSAPHAFLRCGACPTSKPRV